MKNSTSIVFYVSIIIVFITASLYIWLLNDLSNNVQEISEISNGVFDKKIKNNYMRVLKNIVDSTDNDMKILDALFVDPLEVAELLQDIENFGNYIGVPVTIKSIGDKGDIVTITATVTGSFKQVIHFVDLANVLPKAIFIESLHINKHKKKKVWDGVVKLTVLKQIHEK